MASGSVQDRDEYMNSAAEMTKLSRSQLHHLMLQGHPIDPRELAGWAYHGVSLGLPRWLERVTWKTFTKAFVYDAGYVRGWNIKMKQTGEAGPRIPITKNREPKVFGAFDVQAKDRHELRNEFPEALVLNYGTPKNSDFGLRTLRDPLVAIKEGDSTLLLGCSWLRVSGRNFPTPSYFTLERAESVQGGQVLWGYD